MGFPLVQVDAFTDKPFRGNPAAVCILPEPKDAGWMQSVAGEMNLSETSFLVRQEDGFQLRWFTPAVEVDLCGHATLASAHALWEAGYLKPGQQARFHTRSGLLTAQRQGDWIEMDLPAKVAEACACHASKPKAEVASHDCQCPEKKVEPVSINGSSSSFDGVGEAIGWMPRAMKNARISSPTSERPMNFATAAGGRLSSVAVASAATSGSWSATRKTSSASCSSARGASAPRAASRRISLSTSPRRKQSSTKWVTIKSADAAGGSQDSKSASRKMVCRALRPAEPLQHGVQRSRLALGLPGRGGTGDAREHVEHRVEIRREGEPDVLVVVAGVDDHGEVLAAQLVEAVGELCAADLPGECDDRSHARF